MFGIPDKLTNFLGYDEGKEMIGVADVSLPDLAYMTESLKGAGIAGEIDSPVIGHFQSMTVTINWRTLTDENVTFIEPKAYMFDFQGSVQFYNEGKGEYESKKVKAVMKCVPKKFGQGKLDVGTSMGTSGEFEVLYYKLSIENKEYIEIDKVNAICKINGTDYLAKVRKDIGRE